MNETNGQEHDLADIGFLHVIGVDSCDSCALLCALRMSSGVPLFCGPVHRGFATRWFTRFVGHFLLMMVLPVTLANSPGLLSDRFIVQHWEHRDGLPDDPIRCLAQTRDRSIWIGTRRGLFQFDGRRFYGFDRSNVPAMIDEDVLAVAEDSNGDLWVSCTRGLLRSSPSGFVRVGIPPELVKPQGGYLHVTPHGNLWLEGTLPGRHFAVGNQVIRVHDSRTEGFLGWVDANDYRWLVGQDWQIKRVSPLGSAEVFGSIAPTSQHPSFKSAVDAAGQAWFLISDGSVVGGQKLYRFDGKTLSCVVQRAPDNAGRPTAVALDSLGGVWLTAGEHSGLARWSNQELELLRFGTNTQEIIPQALLTDRDGSLWVGTEGAGLYRITRRLATVLTTRQGLPRNAVRCVGAGDAGQLLVGTDDGLAAFTAQSNRPPRFDRVALTNKSIRAISASVDGTLWIGTSRGLFRVRDGIEESIPLQTVRTEPLHRDPQRLASVKIRSLVARPDGSVWFAGAIHVSALFPGFPRARVVAFEGSDFRISKLMPDRHGNLWFAETQWGVGYFSSNAIVQLTRDSRRHGLSDEEVFERETSRPEFLTPPALRLTTTNGLSSTILSDMYEDSDGGIWMATQSGLNYFPPQSTPKPITRDLEEALGVSVEVKQPPYVFTRIHGLPHHSINNLVEDNYGNLWCGTDTEIFAVPISALKKIALGSGGVVHPRIFSEADGLLSLETDGLETHKGSCKLSDGRICFATAMGVAIFDASQLDQSLEAPPSLVQEVIADGELIHTDLQGITQALVEGVAIPTQLAQAGLELQTTTNGPRVALENSGLITSNVSRRLSPGRGRTLEFRFGTREFLAVNQCRFRYRLEGLDAPGVWHDAQERRTAHFNSLPPGRYVFQVKAINRRWKSSNTPGIFEFELEPYVWQRTWFKILTPSLLAAAIFLGIQWRVREVRRLTELRSQYELLRERAGIARDLHDGLGAHVAELALLSTLMPKLPPEKSASMGSRLEHLGREVSIALRNTVWAATPQADNLRGLVAHMNETFARQTAAAGIQFEGDSPSILPELQLSGHFRRSLFWAVQESITNAIKHSGATKIQMTLRLDASHLELEIQDDGKGFRAGLESTELGFGTTGNGLRNQRLRLGEIGGTAELLTSPGTGTRTRFQMPIPTKSAPDFLGD